MNILHFLLYIKFGNTDTRKLLTMNIYPSNLNYKRLSSNNKKKENFVFR